VDFDESAVQNRFVVKPNVDLELDESKYFVAQNVVEIKHTN